MKSLAFEFEALTADGRVRRGVIQAASAEDAMAALRARGEMPISAIPHSVQSVGTTQVSARTPLRERDVELLFSQLARLVAAGLPLARALSALADGAPGTARGTVATRLLAALREGQPPAQAFQAIGFEAGIVALVRSGEASGDLAAALGEIERLAIARNAFLGRVRTALVYPAILVAVSLGAVATILLAVIPQFASLVGDRMDRLNLAATLTFWFSAVLREHGVVLLVAMFVALGLVLRSAKASSFSAVLVTAVRRCPGGAGLVTAHQTAALLRLLGALLSRQVGLVPGLDIARTVLIDSQMRTAAASVRERLTSGERLGSAMAATGAFPPAVVQLAKVGEETGDLGNLLTRAAQLLEDDLDRRAKLFLIWFEPILLIIMGLMIGGLLYGLFSAIFAINDLI